jgi:XTP/dITP diphosphohydrolase
MKPKIIVNYVTSSDFKVQENEAFRKHYRLKDGSLVDDVFEFHIRKIPVKEILEIDLSVMVMAEVTEAYSSIKVPCVVEHAGLVFDGYHTYPGGLTKPMWNSLDSKFIEETRSADRKAKARAVVGYCDGNTVKTFVGETAGTIAPEPRGEREFYWDTVFIPEDAKDDVAGKTYAEIVKNKGPEFKMKNFSQSSKAMIQFLEFRRTHTPELWPY